MPSSQAWRRHAFGYSLRVYQADKDWQGEIRMEEEQRVIRTGVFSNLMDALSETCQRARRLSGLPETDDLDPCCGSGVWQSFDANVEPTQLPTDADRRWTAVKP
jgi:hypothetical protein